MKIYSGNCLPWLILIPCLVVEMHPTEQEESNLTFTQIPLESVLLDLSNDSYFNIYSTEPIVVIPPLTDLAIDPMYSPKNDTPNNIPGEDGEKVEFEKDYLELPEGSLNISLLDLNGSQLIAPFILQSAEETPEETVALNFSESAIIEKLPGSETEICSNWLINEPELNKTHYDLICKSVEADTLAPLTIFGIVSGVLLIIFIIAGLVAAYILRKKFTLKFNFRHHSLSRNSEQGTYLDDSFTSSVIGSQYDLSKDNQEEMMSLDNDSYLNSLESMTIDNYWTDGVKNTTL